MENNLSNHFDQIIEKLSETEFSKQLKGIQRGIEKECLRVSTSGYLSQNAHPKSLGATLTHPYITTDYSEVLMEFITPPSTDPDYPVSFLESIHQVVYQNIGDEYLWNASMPCMMTAEKDIPIAEYGSSNIGRMKYIYRVGLGHRYGKLMQTIAGVHYNFSIPESIWLILFQADSAQPQNADLNSVQQSYISDRYMGLIRNYQRHCWMLPYLFGASPAVCNSFLGNKDHQLKSLSDCTSYGPNATSLRMGDLGYSNNAQSQLNISYNSLAEYVEGLEHAIHTPEPLYQKIGVKQKNAAGEWQYNQLNSNLLQIENEYYSNIRPKRVSKSGQRPAKALSQGGIEYIEVRGLDVNPFTATGISNQQIYWLDCFLMTCLLLESPTISCREQANISENLSKSVNQGREPGIHLNSGNQMILLSELGQEFAQKMLLVAKLFDSCWNTHRYTLSVQQWAECFQHPEKTLSGQLMQQIQTKNSYFGLIKEMSLKHKQLLMDKPLESELAETFYKISMQSLGKQQQLEAEHHQSFEEFLETYFQP